QSNLRICGIRGDSQRHKAAMELYRVPPLRQKGLHIGCGPLAQQKNRRACDYSHGRQHSRLVRLETEPAIPQTSTAPAVQEPVAERSLPFISVKTPFQTDAALAATLEVEGA